MFYCFLKKKYNITGDENLLTTFFEPFLLKCDKMKEAMKSGENQSYKLEMLNILFDLMGCFQTIEQFYLNSFSVI